MAADGYIQGDGRTRALILDVERALPGMSSFVSGNIDTDRRRTTLTRHMNHHVGTQPPPAPSSGYTVTSFTTSTMTPSTSVAPPAFPPPFRVQLPGGQNPGSRTPAVLPPPGYSRGTAAPSPNPYGSQPVGYTPRTTRSGHGTSPPQGTSRPQRYTETRSSLPPPPQFTPTGHSRSYSESTNTFPVRPQRGDQSTLRVHEYQPPLAYDLRQQPDRRQMMSPPQQQQQQQPASRGAPSFPPSSPMHPPPPPSPSRRQGHRRIASEMDVPEETEEERVRKRRRSDRGP